MPQEAVKTLALEHLDKGKPVSKQDPQSIKTVCYLVGDLFCHSLPQAQWVHVGFEGTPVSTQLYRRLAYKGHNPNMLGCRA